MLLSESLSGAAQRFPDKNALTCGGERHSYASLELRANRLGNALAEGGLRRHDRVAIYLENSAEIVVSLFAALKAGGAFVIVNPQVRPHKLAYILNDCDVKALVTDARHLVQASEALASCRALERIVLAGDGTLPEEAAAHLSRFRTDTLAALENGFPATPPPVRSIDVDLASLIYTSGSTGNPKGVVLTHHNMVSAADSIVQYLGLANDDIILGCLPLAFDYGLYQVLMACRTGASVVLEKSFTFPYRIVELLLRERVTAFPVVPTMVVLLSQLKNMDRYRFPDLRFVTNTAQALTTRHISLLKQLFPGARIFSMYGLTECKRVAYLPPEAIDRKPGSVGTAMPNCETFIVDEKGERITAPGVTGELVVRGSNVMQGYWRLPEETARRIKPGPLPGERLLYTGDIFRMDEEGYLYYVARRDDLIKTAGERVSPREIEEVLYEMEGIAEAAVFGVPDDLLGQAIKAVVVLREGSALTAKEIVAHCARRLESFRVPKIVELREAMPTTMTGKIKKSELAGVGL